MHTAKPWTFDGVAEGHIHGGPKRPYGGTRVVVCRDINPADVPLILAAPALLEALKEMCGALGDIWGSLRNHMPIDPDEYYSHESKTSDEALLSAATAIARAEDI